MTETYGLGHDDLPFLFELLDFMRQLDLLTPEFEELVSDAFVSGPCFLG